jgi:hypothetical protein
MAIKFIILYFCNLVLDYPLQGSFLAGWKSKNNYILFVHSAIWSLGISIALLYLGLFEWWKVGMLLVGHFVIDYWKCHRLYLKKSERESEIGKRDFRALYIDQTLHFIQILLCLL